MSVSLSHELQSQVGGFLGNSLYLLHSSALVGVATVSIHTRELHAVCVSNGQSKFERSGVWIQDASCNKAKKNDQPTHIKMSCGVPELYLSRCHSQVSTRHATAGHLLEVSSWAPPERLGDPTKPGRDQVSLTELHSAPPMKINHVNIKLGLFWLVNIASELISSEDLVKRKRVSIEDVIKTMVSVETGFSKCGNHDASPGSTCHYVSTLTKKTKQTQGSIT